MTEQELKDLAQKVQSLASEFQAVEVKAAHVACPQRLYDTLSAFSNQDEGGILLFGLDESRGFEAVGVYDVHDLQKHVTEQCLQMTPPVRPLFTAALYRGKSIVSAEIPSIDVSERPCSYSGVGRIKGSYVRSGTADQLMSEYEIYSYEAYRRKYQDDIRENVNASLAIFDKERLDAYLGRVLSEKPNLARLEKQERLELLRIVHDGFPTLLGIVLFSLFPQVFYPQYTINATVVPGLAMGEVDSDGARFLDNRRIEGTLPEMLSGALVFCRKNMTVKTVVDPVTGERRDKEQYPVTALREAILNALIHRDYSLHTQGTPVEITFYKNRLEICNPGGLYGRLRIDDLGKVQPDTRNPTLARAMETLGLVENRYSGIPTIRRELRAAGLPDPEFRDSRQEFKVTFYNDIQSGAVLEPGEKDLKTFCKAPRSREEIADYLGLKSFHHVKKRYIDPLLAKGILKMTLPEKPRSKKQRYYS